MATEGPILLGADIGGTSSRFGLFTEKRGRLRLLLGRVVRTRDFDSPRALIDNFLVRQGLGPDRACLGIASPMAGDIYDPPNLPWRIDPSALRAEYSFPIAFVNDFEALAHGLFELAPEDTHSLQVGTPEPEGAIAVLGPGTGLGQGFLTRKKKRTVVHASEGGHVGFAPRNDLQVELLTFLRETLEHVSVERILSGAGLLRLLRFFVERRGLPPVEPMPDRDEVATFVAREARGGNETCSRVLQLFTDILGVQAGNLALTVWATGGVYLAGGIARRILGELKTGPFLEAFSAKGRYRRYMERMPVTVVTHPSPALWGAARVAAGTER